MPRLDSLAFLTLNAMADDWESIAQIERQVNEYHGPVKRDEIFVTLRRLFRDEYLRVRCDERRNTQTPLVSVVPQDGIHGIARSGMRSGAAWKRGLDS